MFSRSGFIYTAYHFPIPRPLICRQKLTTLNTTVTTLGLLEYYFVHVTFSQHLLLLYWYCLCFREYNHFSLQCPAHWHIFIWRNIYSACHFHRRLPTRVYYPPTAYRPSGGHWPMTRHMSTPPCPPQAAQHLNRRLWSMTCHVPTLSCPSQTAQCPSRTLWPMKWHLTTVPCPSQFARRPSRTISRMKWHLSTLPCPPQTAKWLRITLWPIACYLSTARCP